MKKILVIILLIALNASAQMAVSRRAMYPSGGGTPNTFTAPTAAGAHCHDTEATGTAVSCILSASITSGKLVIAYVQACTSPGCSTTPSSVTVIAGSGKSFTQSASSPNTATNANSGSAYIFWRLADGTESTTVTATIGSGTCAACAMHVEVFGASGGTSSPTIDADFKSSTTSTTTTVNTPTINQSVAGELLVCFVVNQNAGTTNGSPWTAGPDGVDSFGGMTQYILASSGNQACNFTQTSGQYAAIGAAFK